MSELNTCRSKDDVYRVWFVAFIPCQSQSHLVVLQKLIVVLSLWYMYWRQLLHGKIVPGWLINCVLLFSCCLHWENLTLFHLSYWHIRCLYGPYAEHRDICINAAVGLYEIWQVTPVHDFSWFLASSVKGPTGPENSWNSFFDFSGPEKSWIRI